MPNNIYDNVSEKDLKTGYWYVTHRVLLRQLFILFLVAVAGSLTFYGAMGLVTYYVVDRAERAAIQADLTKSKLNQNLLAEINTPQQIQVLGTTVLKTGDNGYDFVAEITNPNQQWAARAFDYSFLLADDEKTNVKTDFILPGQNKYALYLNYQSAKNINSANILIENIKWEKVANYAVAAEKFLQFEFANAVAMSGSDSGLTAPAGDAGLAGFRFDIINRSAYNFWEPRFTVLLMKQGSMVGVFSVALDKIDAGEKVGVSRNVFQSVPRNVEIQVFPDVNILDPAVFKGFDVNSGEFK